MYPLQIISLAIYALVMIGALRDFKRAVLVWVPMSMLFNPQVCVWYNQPITALTVVTDLSLVLLYFIKYRGETNSNQSVIHKEETHTASVGDSKLKKKTDKIKSRFNPEAFFFKPAVVAMAVSYMLATLFSDMPFASSFNKIVKQLVDYFGIVFLVFRCLNNKQDVTLFVKALAVSSFIFCTNGIIEGIVKENLWGDFVFFTSKCDETTEERGWHYPNFMTGGGNMRFGMIRCYSVFQLHLVFGFACCLTSYLMFRMKDAKVKLINKLSYKKNNFIYIALLCMLMLSIVMCNSKGPMICAVLILLTHYKFKHLFNIWTVLPLIIGVIVILIYFPDYINNWLSLTDEDVAEEGGGSTIVTRQMQFNAALELFYRNPLFGNGIHAVQYYKQFGFEELLGAESIWLKLLPDQGIFGVFAYLLMYVVLYNDAKKYIPTKVYFFYFLAVFTFDTTNGGAYGKIIWWLSIYFVIRRYYQLKKKKKRHDKLLLHNTSPQLS